jgi:hypothetical protein
MAAVYAGCGSSMKRRAPSWRRRFFPPTNWGEVPPATVQAQLRLVFSRWGMPQRFRVDNGIPWGSKGDLPTDLALWLIGLGVDMIWNPARQPQDNGVVERSQGTAKRWAEPHACRSLAELQRRLREADRIQREVYPTKDGRSRWEVYPTLRHSGRSYTPTWERRHWRLSRVLDHLANYTVQRKVSQTGHVSLYNRGQYLGKMHQGKIVYVMLDPDDGEWIFADPAGQQLRRRAAPEISRPQIVNLKVTHRRSDSKAAKARGKT